MTATFAVRRDAVRMFEEDAKGFPKHLVGGGDVIFEKVFASVPKRNCSTALATPILIYDGVFFSLIK